MTGPNQDEPQTLARALAEAAACTDRLFWQTLANNSFQEDVTIPDADELADIRSRGQG